MRFRPVPELEVRIRFFLGIVIALLIAEPLSAATRQWQGGSGRKWSTGANWVGGTAPSSGDDLIFSASPVSFSNLNDVASATAFNSITINGNYTLADNSITLGAGGVSDNSSAIVTFAITFGASQQIWTVTGARLTINAPLSGSATFEKSIATIFLVLD